MKSPFGENMCGAYYDESLADSPGHCWGLIAGRNSRAHGRSSSGCPAREDHVLGLNKVIAFTYGPAKIFDLKQLHSMTFIGPVDAGDWKYWQSRGVVSGLGHTWFDLLRSPMEKAVDNLTGQDFGGNPQPVVMIDEFGFDYGGQMDQKSAQILRLAKRKKPELALAVFDMRGPVAASPGGSLPRCGWISSCLRATSAASGGTGCSPHRRGPRAGMAFSGRPSRYSE